MQRSKKSAKERLERDSTLNGAAGSPLEPFASKPRVVELKSYLERFSWRTYMESKYYGSSERLSGD